MQHVAQQARMAPTTSNPRKLAQSIQGVRLTGLTIPLIRLVLRDDLHDRSQELEYRDYQ